MTTFEWDYAVRNRGKRGCITTGLHEEQTSGTEGAMEADVRLINPEEEINRPDHRMDSFQSLVMQNFDTNLEGKSND